MIATLLLLDSIVGLSLILPCVRFGRLTAGPRPYLIELCERRRIQDEACRAHCALELFHGARPYDGRRDRGIGEEPCKTDLGGRRAQLLAEGLIRGESLPVLFNLLCQVFIRPPARCGLFQGAAEEAAGKRAVRDR